MSQEICHVPGFTVLQWLLPKHNNVTEAYILLMAMLLGQTVINIPADATVSTTHCRKTKEPWHEMRDYTTCTDGKDPDLPSRVCIRAFIDEIELW